MSNFYFILQIKPEPNSITSQMNSSDDSCSDDESPKRKYREMLTRRPSYRKILNDLGSAEIAGKFPYKYFCLFTFNSKN